MMNLLFIYDEYTDIADGEVAGKIRDIVMDAFRHPERPHPEGEFLLGEMIRESVSFLHFLRMSSHPSLTFKLLDSRIELCGPR